MDKTNTQHAPNGDQPSVYPQFLKPGTAPISTKAERTPDPKETAQEAVHQVMSKDAVTVIPGPAKDVADAPLRAAKGDDDVMSQEKKSS